MYFIINTLGNNYKNNKRLSSEKSHFCQSELVLDSNEY